MFGFSVSESQFIGPTPNIQMAMPFEMSVRSFFADSSITDSVWTEDWYKKLLPSRFLNHFPVYGTYYAGAAGRTEIISHGTAVDPRYYLGKPYYPHTPSMGCLTTSEIWDEKGRRTISNQQQLVNALLKAGGAHGYCIVLEIDDRPEPVTLKDVQRYLPAN